jgi:hypothetical protein
MKTVQMVTTTAMLPLIVIVEFFDLLLAMPFFSFCHSNFTMNQKQPHFQHHTLPPHDFNQLAELKSSIQFENLFSNLKST